MISDRGQLVTAVMLREGGRLRALQIQHQMRFTDANGMALNEDAADAEGLAIDSRGRAYVSFERQHRVARVNLQSGRVSKAQPEADFSGLQFNSGLEALAVHPDGGLFTLPERSGAQDRPFPVFCFRFNKWQRGPSIPRRGPFLPVGADFDDKGLLYLLERAVTPLGFRSRIRRFDFVGPVLREETILITGPGQFDNLEALSVWQDTKGQTYLTMIADDNFLPIQRSQIVEYIVTE